MIRFVIKLKTHLVIDHVSNNNYITAYRYAYAVHAGDDCTRVRGIQLSFYSRCMPR